ncbi:hypothetical protein ACLOJK_040790 [Asimina triloba]
MVTCMIKHLIDCCLNPRSSTTAGQKVEVGAVDDQIASRVTETDGGDDDDDAVVRASEERPMQWEVEVDEGVFVTFLSQPGGPNHIRNIRFSKEVFNTREAKTWWTQNSEKLMELYNIQRSDTRNLVNPPSFSHSWSTLVGRRSSAASSSMPGHDRESDNSTNTPMLNLSSSTDGTLLSTTEVSGSSTDRGDGIDEWEEEDEPGVSVTIRSYPNGTREIRHVNLR